jgi:hypothetical protein
VPGAVAPGAGLYAAMNAVDPGERCSPVTHEENPTMNAILRRSALVLTAAALTACGGTEDEAEVVVTDPEVVAEPAAEPAGDMEGMQGMTGMESMQQGGIAAQLQGHMQMMGSASGGELVVMLPEHRQLVANMIAQMNKEMRDMEMGDNAEWNTTVDALREDLVRLPEMSPDELQAFIPEHQARIDRLVEMHRGMMDRMQM